MDRVKEVLLVAFIVSLWQTVLFAQAGLSIKVQNDSGQAIAGVEIRIENGDGFSVRATTNAEGQVRITGGLARGSYRIAASLPGFEETSQTFNIEDERQAVDIDVTLHAKLSRKDQIDVVADAEELSTQQTSSAGTVLQSAEINSVLVRAATVADSLPLVPGVNRGPNGEILIGGQGEQRSALLVNSSDVTDPATGRFGTTVPVGSVESIDVFRTPFLPEYGKFTSGVVSVATRRGSDKWRFSLKDPVPDFRVRSGHLRGMRDTVPKVGIGGPVIPNQLYISQSTDYTLDKRPVRTLSFPRNESKVEGVNSFTQLDYILSTRHFLTGTVHLAPQHINFVDPQFFNPQPGTPSFRGFEGSWTITEHAGISGGLLDSGLNYQGFRARIGAQGEEDMVLTPTGNRGNYFARRTRESSRIEWAETFSRPINTGHDLKFGSLLARTTNEETFAFKPIEIWDQDQRRLQRIEFTGGTHFKHVDVETALFAQDHWTLLPNVSLDGGARLEYQNITKTSRLAPRIGASWNPLHEGHLILRGGIGVFYDRVPLAIYSFSHYPEQVVTNYVSGQTVGKPRRFSNVTRMLLGSRFPLLISRRIAGNFAPYSKTWTLELEHTIARALHLRFGYQHSDSAGVMLVTPGSSNGNDALVLDGAGRSIHRQFEMLAKVNWKNGQQMLFSFIHGKTRGDLNQFDHYLSDYPAAFLRPNEFSNLRGDIPNRFLSWGFVNLPWWKMRLAPIFEYRTGHPYAIIDSARNYVGTPYHDSTRLLNFFSLDMSLSKQIKVLSRHTVRVALTGLNLTNHFNALDVHANTADPQFGVFFGHYKRRYRFDFELMF